MKHRLMVMVALAWLALGGERARAAPDDDQPALGLVELTAAGAKPRKLLRYKVAKGTHVTLDMKLKVGLEGGGLSGTSAPPVTVTFEQTCTAVDAGGAMRFESRVVAVAVAGSDQAAAAMKAAMDPLKGLVLRFRLSPTGAVDDVDIGGLSASMADLAQSMRDTVDRLIVPLPTKAVGKGATWRVRRARELNGIRMVNQDAFELASVAGQVASVTVRGEIDAPPQTIQKGGVSIEIESVDGTIGGRLAVDLRRFTSTGSQDATIDISMTAGGHATPLHMAMSTATTAR